MKRIVFLILFFISMISFSQQYNPLATGDWYKISLKETGIYKITYDDLVSYGIDPDQIDPRNLSLYGNPAGMLSEVHTDTTDYKRVQAMAIKVVGEDDGFFDTEDYILFYGQSPVTWKYDSTLGQFHHQVNYYTDETYYYISVRNNPGKRIQTQPNSDLPHTGIINQYDLLYYHELDTLNLLKSGKQWLGETFDDNSVLSFSLDFNDYLVYPSNSWFSTLLASNSTDTNFFNLSINDNQVAQIDMPRVPGNNYLQRYRLGIYDTLGSFGSTTLTIDFEYNFPNDSSIAWLDYFELNLKTGPYFYGNNFSFRTTENIGEDSISYFYFNLNSPESYSFWDVTHPTNVSAMSAEVNEDDVAWFQIETESLREFYGFNGTAFYTPNFVEQVANQNLWGVSGIDYLIITYPEFLDPAQDIANFHSDTDGFNTEVVTTEQVYNEFSTGSPDVSAIRNCIWFFKTKSANLKYVLLVGDASYDYKYRVPNNTNFVPTWESFESANMVHSFATDRYFSVQDMYDQSMVEQLALGRMPVSTIDEANAMVLKIEAYASTYALGPWKNETMFIADDGDQNLHQTQANTLAALTEENSKFFNISKNYLDFYTPVETNDGPRIPEVTTEINEKMNNGVFYVNFNGHGRSTALTFEKVLTVPELSAWGNIAKTPLWVIASGDVAKYDNPDLVSLGEEILLQQNAGAISVISSSNLQYAHVNMMMNSEILEKFTDENLQATLRYGDLFNNPIKGESYLKWTFLGDPALKIGFPNYLVSTTELNDEDIELYTDTISPGSTIKLTGQIVDREDNVVQNWFNGTVYLKILAPAYLRETMGNQSTPEEILVQDSVLAEVTGEVQNGEFQISVTLPSKFYEDYGKLKLSSYAENAAYAENGEDANGYYNQLMFGGEPDGVDEFGLIAQNIKAYPTPFTSEINLELPRLEDDSFSISVYDLLGVQVYSKELSSRTTSKKINLDFLMKGIYVLNIRNSVGSKNIKLLKK